VDQLLYLLVDERYSLDEAIQAGFAREVVVVGFDGMGDDKFASAVRARWIVVKGLDGVGAIFVAELVDTGVNGHGEFAVEYAWAIGAIDVNVVFAKGRIDAIDNGVEVFVDQERTGAEDDEIIVEYADGVIEVRFGED